MAEQIRLGIIGISNQGSTCACRLVKLPLADEHFDQMLAKHQENSTQRSSENIQVSEITGSYSER